VGKKKPTSGGKIHKRSGGKYGKNGQYLYRCSGCNEIVVPYYYAAFNCIDWSIPGQRIGDRNKPLAENTRKRIQYGLDKYKDHAFILNTNSTTGISCRVTSLYQATQTHTGSQSQSILHPFLIKQEHSHQPGYTKNAAIDSMWTQTTWHSQALVAPFIIEANRTGKARGVDQHISTILAGGNHHWLVGNYTPGWTRPVSSPTGTVTTSDHHGLLQIPLIVENKGQSKSKTVLSPISTMTTKGCHGLITTERLQSFLSYYYSGSNQASNMVEAIRTVSTNDRASLVTANYSSKPKIEDCYYRMLKAHEIQRAMAFDDDYIILGNVKQKVKQLGNAVTPPVMTWIIQRVVSALTK
jgi:DNA (cytosine-5)-methyltransferase 1